MSQQGEEYITVEEAAQRVGVTRASLYYYIKELGIETKRFRFDKKSYLHTADFQRIQDVKNESPSARKATFRAGKAGTQTDKEVA